MKKKKEQNKDYLVIHIMKVAVYRRAHFNAAHRLHVNEFDDAKNEVLFGLCNNPHYHGHNYELEVKVVGEVDPITGMVIDMKFLKELIQDKIESKFDHKNINIQVPEFKNLNPTCENICIVIYQILQKELGENYELTVRLYESPRNYAEYPVR